MKLNGMRTRKSCDCGEPATIMLCNALICQGCFDKDKRQEAPFEKSDDWKMSFQWDNSDVDEACTRWLKKRGLYNERGFQRISYGTIQSGVEALLAKL